MHTVRTFGVTAHKRRSRDAGSVDRRLAKYYGLDIPYGFWSRPIVLRSGIFSNACQVSDCGKTLKCTDLD